MWPPAAVPCRAASIDPSNACGPIKVKSDAFSGGRSRHGGERVNLGYTSLLAEPGILKAPAIEKAVDHDRDPVHCRRPAGPQAIIEDHRPRRVLLQPAVDLPDQLLAL